MYLGKDKSPFIIAIEGIDGSGKTMQWELLADALRSEGKVVDCLSFPVYHSFFGREVGLLLSGKGQVRADELDSRSLCLWYALDRYAAFRTYREEKQQEGSMADVILINRFTLSNAVYQSIRDIDVGLPDNWPWVKELEQKQLGLPDPDLYIILDADPLAAQDNVDQKGAREYVEGRDVYESQEGLLTRARARYLDIAAREKNMDVIYCMDGKRRMLPPVDIARQIREMLRKRWGV